MFVQGEPTVRVAQRLRVSEKSVRQWRRAWKAGGVDALASAGPGGSTCKLTGEQVRQLIEVLDAGPAAQGWVDQRWTLARIAEVIHRLFGVDYTAAWGVLPVAPHWLYRSGSRPAGGRT